MTPPRAGSPRWSSRVAAFALYRATLLPGVDFGDTGVVPDDGRVAADHAARRLPAVLRHRPRRSCGSPAREPAHALNLASAVEARASPAACSSWSRAELSGSLARRASRAALLFAGSYTFWSQAIIAEVYALHIVLVALDAAAAAALGSAADAARLGAVLRRLRARLRQSPVDDPAAARLRAVPAAVGAAAAGDRCSRRASSRSRSLCAAAGALQYAWNLRDAVAAAASAATACSTRSQRFWFDVTKSDWRETMVMNVPRVDAARSPARCTGSICGSSSAGRRRCSRPSGSLQLARTSWRRARAACSALFAVERRVRVQLQRRRRARLLPAVAPDRRAAGRAGASCRRRGRVAAQRHGRRRRALLGAVTPALARIATIPALDRSRDARPTQMLDALTAGLDDRHAILLTDLNWQMQNGLSYFAKAMRPEIAYARMPDVLLYAPALVPTIARSAARWRSPSARARRLERRVRPAAADRAATRASRRRRSPSVVARPAAGHALCAVRAQAVARFRARRRRPRRAPLAR